MKRKEWKVKDTGKRKEVIHYPNLKTVLMVEEILKKADTPLSKNEILRRMPKKTIRQTLRVIIDYLEYSGKIVDGDKGVVWTFNENKKLDAAIKAGVEV
ncbi:MAG TPA: hypothetical protein VFF28_04370 [Candidatus Nanoarchaeia archaeon]|nr:hypothetical protein [Candidatus Nanoarchaeia archaeon]